MRKEIADRIVEYALELVGEEELPNNGGFKNPVLQLNMDRIGFRDGQAWCALLGEVIWTVPTYPGKSKYYPYLSDNFSANAFRTYENFFKDTGGLFEVNNKFAPGCLVIFRKMRNGQPVKRGIWTLGHLGIGYEELSIGFKCIEGNTNDDGSREGYKVAIKARDYNYSVSNGLQLVGFVHMV